MKKLVKVLLTLAVLVAPVSTFAWNNPDEDIIYKSKVGCYYDWNSFHYADCLCDYNGEGPDCLECFTKDRHDHSFDYYKEWNGEKFWVGHQDELDLLEEQHLAYEENFIDNRHQEQLKQIEKDNKQKAKLTQDAEKHAKRQQELYEAMFYVAPIKDEDIIKPEQRPTVHPNTPVTLPELEEEFPIEDSSTIGYTGIKYTNKKYDGKNQYINIWNKEGRQYVNEFAQFFDFKYNQGSELKEALNLSQSMDKTNRMTNVMMEQLYFTFLLDYTVFTCETNQIEIPNNPKTEAEMMGITEDAYKTIRQLKDLVTAYQMIYGYQGF